MTLVSDLAGRPTTAHYIGGAAIGEGPDTGVVDLTGSSATTDCT